MYTPESYQREPVCHHPKKENSEHTIGGGELSYQKVTTTQGKKHMSKGLKTILNSYFLTSTCV